MQTDLSTSDRKTYVERVDVAVAQAIAPIRQARSVRILGAISELADQPPLAAISSSVFFYGLFRGDRALAETGGRMLVAHLLSTAIKSAIKARVVRTRPHLIVEGREYDMHAGERDTHPLNSFPSGHTAGAVAVARAVVRGHPARRSSAYALAAGAALIQIPRCAHYPSDVAAGAAIGVATEAIVYAAEALVASTFGKDDHRRSHIPD